MTRPNRLISSGIFRTIDGQQRLIAIHKFLTNKFSIRIDNREFRFEDLGHEKMEEFTSYKLSGHSLTDWQYDDVTFLFERLNRTGTVATNMEVWNAKYGQASILGMLKEISKNHEGYYVDIIYTNIH